eukprot:jgi/Mesen1/421/ME000100S10649
MSVTAAPSAYISTRSIHLYGLFGYRSQRVRCRKKHMRKSILQLKQPGYGLFRPASCCMNKTDMLINTEKDTSTQIPAATKLRLAVLKNGLPVRYVSKSDFQFLYTEIFEEFCYLQCGVTIGPEDVVFDVGANIGLFSAFAAQTCPKGQVYAFEPIPDIYEALAWNMASLRRFDASAELANVRLFNMGVSSGDLQEETFTFFTQAAGWSSKSPDQLETKENMDVFIGNALQSPAALGFPALSTLGRVLNRWGPRWAYRAASKLLVQSMLASQVQVRCATRSISQIMAQEGIERIDLLKIDVERAELEVLRGVLPSDWPRIRQVAMEVHGSDGRLEQVKELLAEAGFTRVTACQSSMLQGTTLYSVFAVR